MPSSSYYDGNVILTDLGDIDLDSKHKVFSKDSFAKVQDPEDIFHTRLFQKVASGFIAILKDADDELYDYFNERLNNITEDLTSIVSLLLYVKKDNVAKDYPKYAAALSDGGLHMRHFLDLLRNYYLKKDKFCFLSEDEHHTNDVTVLERKMTAYKEAMSFIVKQIDNNLRDKPPLSVTEINYGFSGGFLVKENPIPLTSDYDYLQKIRFIKNVRLILPYVTRTKKNKRIGHYQESKEKLAGNLDISPDEWLAFPIRVGVSLVYFYFHINFINDVIGIINLFQLANLDEVAGTKPDILIVFGGRKGETTGTYYHDDDNDIWVGYVSDVENADYFGYVKKLILTLHNIRMIRMGALPIHGSMVNITMKSGKRFAVVIMGDSGAGKSESIEAFRRLSKEYLKDIEVIFDDMGTLFLTEDGVKASGTEIGAFVRIDDLGYGYTFTHLNDSIIYNVEKSNARIVYRCTPYQEVIKKWDIDIFLYANNYEETDKGLAIMDDCCEVASICEQGRRVAKGTTGEVGMTETYFANPFGPLQLKEESQPLVHKMFKAMDKQRVALGVLYTQLAVEGQNEKGPEKAARKLFAWINEKADQENS